MGYTTRPLRPDFGVEIVGADLAQIDAELTGEIIDALVEHALVLLRHQSLDDADIYRVCSAFGPVEEPAAKRNHSPQFREINYISNLKDADGRLIGGLTPADQDEGVWHSDQAFRKHPATISTLFCIHAPQTGGGTGFISTRLGYTALPEPLKRQAGQLSGNYLPGKNHEIDKIEVTHPVVLENPRNGRRSLYVSPATLGFDGLDEAQSATLKTELLKYQMRDQHRYTYHWRMGDMLIYDNAQLLHRREAFAGLRWLKATRTFAPQEYFAVPD
jgi:taurine dioxygenase